MAVAENGRSEMENINKIKRINRCIRRIACGRTDALEELFALTKRRLLIVARTYLWDKSKAEDVLSESYYKVVINADTFDVNRNGYNWIYEIVKNTALNQNEKDKLRTHYSLEEIKEPTFDAVDELLDHIMAEEAVLSLTDEEKELIYRYFFEGLTIQEIANFLKKPKTTVYDQFQRTLSKMRKQLGFTDRKKKKTVFIDEEAHEKERD